MPQKVWTSDSKGNKNYLNYTLLYYTGLSSEELKGKGWEKIIHPDDRKKPSRMAWLLKEQILPPMYWDGMLKGREWLVKPSL